MVHVFDIEFGLGASDFHSQVEPDIFWNVDSSSKTWSIVDLPVSARIQHWCVLDCIRQTGFVLPQVDPFAVCAIVRKAELNTEEATAGGCRNVDVDDGIAHLKIFQGCDSAVEKERLTVLVFGCFGLPFQFPAR